jgi:hypothetical protein
MRVRLINAIINLAAMSLLRSQCRKTFSTKNYDAVRLCGLMKGKRAPTKTQGFPCRLRDDGIVSTNSGVFSEPKEELQSARKR